MLNKLLFLLTANMPCRIIAIEGRPYLERYSVGKIFGVSFYLHRFVGSDEERQVHDHPWAWAKAIILKGGYVEEVVCALDLERGWISKTRYRRWYNDLGPHVFHRIVSPVPGTWTLFFHGERIKSWGFLDRVVEYQGIENPYVRYYQPYDVEQNAGWEKKVPLGKNSTRMPL